MGFEIKHEESNTSNAIMPEGEYEVIIKSALEDVTKGGTQYINIPLIVRNDIDQTYKNAYVWHVIWKVKEPKDADKACSGYSSWGIQSISKATGLQNGKKYAGLQDWGADLVGKLLRVTIKHEEYNGEMQVKVRYCNPSKFPECNHIYKDSKPAASGAGAPVISEENLPF